MSERKIHDRVAGVPRRTLSQEIARCHPDDPGPKLASLDARLRIAGIGWPASVTVHPTDVCNHHCSWCWFQRSSDRVDMPTVTAALELFVRRGAEEIVVSGGGEPLLHPNVRDLVSALQAWPGVHRRLYTNGSRLSRFPEIHRAFDYVRVSMDAGGAKLYSRLHGARESDYWRILKSLSNIARSSSGTRVGVSVVETSENCHSLDTLIADCAASGVDHVLVKPLLNNTKRASVAHIVQIAEAPQVKIENRSFPLPNLPVRGGPCPLEAMSFSVLIAPDGDLYPCCHLLGEQWRIAAVDVLALSTAIGSDHHRKVLQEYARASHPCGIHDLWSALANGSEKRAPHDATTPGSAQVGS